MKFTSIGKLAVLPALALLTTACLTADPAILPPDVGSISEVPRPSRSNSFEFACLEDPSIPIRRHYNSIIRELGSRGYEKGDVWLAPGGFGFSTPFERIENDGRSISTDRWNTGPVAPNGFLEHAANLFSNSVRPGRYRSFLFVYGRGVSTSRSEQEFSSLAHAVEHDGDGFPFQLRNTFGRDGNRLQVFIYEYVRSGPNEDAEWTQSLGFSQHMAGARISINSNTICS